MEPRPRHVLGGLREYIQQCEEWLRVPHGPRTRRRWDRKARRWRYPEVERKAREAQRQARLDQQAASQRGPARRKRTGQPRGWRVEDYEAQLPYKGTAGWSQLGSQPQMPLHDGIHQGLPGCASYETGPDVGLFGVQLLVFWPDGTVERCGHHRFWRGVVAERGGLAWPVAGALVPACSIADAQYLLENWDAIRQP